jgi:hypothetical protein
MAVQEPSRIRNRKVALAAWTISIVVAVIVFWGTCAFLNSRANLNQPPAGAIMHSNPIGGQTLDGVFHPAEVSGDLTSIRWQI